MPTRHLRANIDQPSPDNISSRSKEHRKSDIRVSTLLTTQLRGSVVESACNWLPLPRLLYLYAICDPLARRSRLRWARIYRKVKRSRYFLDGRSLRTVLTPSLPRPTLYLRQVLLSEDDTCAQAMLRIHTQTYYSPPRPFSPAHSALLPHRALSPIHPSDGAL